MTYFLKMRYVFACMERITVELDFLKINVFCMHEGITIELDFLEINVIFNAWKE